MLNGRRRDINNWQNIVKQNRSYHFLLHCYCASLDTKGHPSSGNTALSPKAMGQFRWVDAGHAGVPCLRESRTCSLLPPPLFCGDKFWLCLVLNFSEKKNIVGRCLCLKTWKKCLNVQTVLQKTDLGTRKVLKNLRQIIKQDLIKMSLSIFVGTSCNT